MARCRPRWCILGRPGVRPGGVFRYGAVAPNYSALCREGITCGEGYRIRN